MTKILNTIRNWKLTLIQRVCIYIIISSLIAYILGLSITYLFETNELIGLLLFIFGFVLGFMAVVLAILHD